MRADALIGTIPENAQRVTLDDIDLKQLAILENNALYQLYQKFEIVLQDFIPVQNYIKKQLADEKFNDLVKSSIREHFLKKSKMFLTAKNEFENRLQPKYTDLGMHYNNAIANARNEAEFLNNLLIESLEQYLSQVKDIYACKENIKKSLLKNNLRNFFNEKGLLHANLFNLEIDASDIYLLARHAIKEEHRKVYSENIHRIKTDAEELWQGLTVQFAKTVWPHLANDYQSATNIFNRSHSQEVLRLQYFLKGASKEINVHPKIQFKLIAEKFQKEYLKQKKAWLEKNSMKDNDAAGKQFIEYLNANPTANHFCNMLIFLLTSMKKMGIIIHIPAELADKKNKSLEELLKKYDGFYPTLKKSLTQAHALKPTGYFIAGPEKIILKDAKAALAASSPAASSPAASSQPDRDAKTTIVAASSTSAARTALNIPNTASAEIDPALTSLAPPLSTNNLAALLNGTLKTSEPPAPASAEKDKKSDEKAIPKSTPAAQFDVLNWLKETVNAIADNYETIGGYKKANTETINTLAGQVAVQTEVSGILKLLIDKLVNDAQEWCLTNNIKEDGRPVLDIGKYKIYQIERNPGKHSLQRMLICLLERAGEFITPELFNNNQEVYLGVTANLKSARRDLLEDYKGYEFKGYELFLQQLDKGPRISPPSLIVSRRLSNDNKYL